MKNRIIALAGVVILAACEGAPTDPSSLADFEPAYAVSGATIVNGSFEDGLTGWTAGDVDVVGPATWTASDGSQSVDLNGFFPGFVSQDITTEVGKSYTVLFDLAGNPGAPQNVKTLFVTFGDLTELFSFDTTGKTGTDMGWTEQSITFTATSTTTTLGFQSFHGFGSSHPDRAQGPAIDNVRFAINDPTEKDQCKKGGWESFGFRNQGQCVRFVQTGKDSR